MTDSVHFYRDLPELIEFSQGLHAAAYQPLPADWWIAVVDVVDSTAAIRQGRYKHVNTVSAATLAALRNTAPGLELPFVFGGDGALCALPAAWRDNALSVLQGVCQMAQREFGLELRAALVSVAVLHEAGFDTQVARLRLSEHVHQPLLQGAGWHEAERRLKSADDQGLLRVRQGDATAGAQFSGFECRWQNFEAMHGHKLALLVQATSREREQNLLVCREVHERIRDIYGSFQSCHPLHPERMKLSLNPLQLSHEWRVRTHGLRWGDRLRYAARMAFENLAGRYLFARGLDTQEVAWSQYRRDLVLHTDHCKLDGRLSMLLDGSQTQYDTLRRYLEQEHAAGKLAFGMHRSPEAIMTCLIESHNGRHVHFVDGSDGGYAMAAQELKRQLGG